MDATLPSGKNTGPWPQSLSAAAAEKLLNGGDITIMSLKEEVSPIEVEVKLLDPRGNVYRGEHSDVDCARMQEDREKRSVAVSAASCSTA